MERPSIFTATGVLSSGGINLSQVELTPDGGDLEIRIYHGTDTSGTECFRLKAVEESANRKYNGLVLFGPLYISFVKGSGAVMLVTTESL